MGRAAAGLYRAMQTLSELGDVKGSVAVRKELLLRYGHTYYATVVKSQSAKSGQEKPASTASE